MSTPDQLPPELRHASSATDGPERVSTWFFGSRRTHRTIAWVVISVLWLVPLALGFVGVLRDLVGL